MPYFSRQNCQTSLRSSINNYRTFAVWSPRGILRVAQTIVIAVRSDLAMLNHILINKRVDGCVESSSARALWATLRLPMPTKSAQLPHTPCLVCLLAFSTATARQRENEGSEPH